MESATNFPFGGKQPRVAVVVPATEFAKAYKHRWTKGKLRRFKVRNFQIWRFGRNEKTCKRVPTRLRWLGKPRRTQDPRKASQHFPMSITTRYWLLEQAEFLEGSTEECSLEMNVNDGEVISSVLNATERIRNPETKRRPRQEGNLS